MDKIEILYEDDFIIAVNKPNNVLIHNSYYARNIKEPTLLEILQEQTGLTLYPVHRLDRKTSGIILLSKKKEDISQLQDAFTQNKIEKIYFGIVRGYSPESGIIETPVKHPETGQYREAETHFTTHANILLEIPVHPYSTSRYSLIELKPKTGRIHQLRIHLNKISHPLVGDYKYGDRFHNRMFEQNFDAHTLFLHAHSLRFVHPKTSSEMYIIAEFPEKWKELANKFKWELSSKNVNKSA